ncbi:M20/M25/M40 family metallo-hydrolase [Paracoccus onubensis]|uniref:M20/M25/M40 family metallo-hydrolase n=1 Tax=Paracoccus onubensis TaxID=1675788 RepID=UPI0027310882|nr:M20/M25/M40 family metallo-hydrolase [Paracoccus onubensis]MDP0926160.1 M20/M25/M40 family metallo-hydrolase [Paracoccus onubensis]
MSVNDVPDRALAELIEWVRIPSHAGTADAKTEAARYCGALLEAAGFTVKFDGPAKAPAVIATLNPDAPNRLLFYSHYDVVAPGDPAAWDHPPFSGKVVDGTLHGRGTSDHKATFIARLEAIRRLQSENAMPLGISFLVEGEEEQGSTSLKGIIIRNRDLLRAGGGLYSGGARTESGQPVIRAGCKGRIGLKLTVALSPRDNHSKWAGLLQNSAWRLIAALATLYDGKRGQVLVEGYRDACVGPNAADEAALGKLDFDTNAFLASSGYEGLRGDIVADPLRLLMFEPTFNIAWLRSGPGGETVLPGNASAMLDLRLVPGQTPAQVEQMIRTHLANAGFADVGIEASGGSEPDKCDLGDPVVQSLHEAALRVHDECCLHPMGAGSGPRYLFRRHLGFNLVQDPGCSWAGSNDHAANENIRIAHFQQNISLMQEFLRTHASRVGLS